MCTPLRGASFCFSLNWIGHNLGYTDHPRQRYLIETSKNHYKFDAGIILRELRRCDMQDLATAWERMASGGYCTMNIPLCRWAVTRADKELQEHAKAKLILTLDTIAQAFRIPACASLLAQHHNAGVDAKISCLVYATTLKDAAAAVTDEPPET